MLHRHPVLSLLAVEKGFIYLLLATTSLVTAASLYAAPGLGSSDPVPSPELEPGEVVRIQVEALRSNNHLDEGIELTYRFASPANRRSTGPLELFTEMIHTAPYDRLLNHISARYSPVAISGDKAYQRVIITDSANQEIAYHWILARQREGEFKDCWMTEAVITAEQPPQREA